jgi:hypothetical protein
MPKITDPALLAQLEGGGGGDEYDSAGMRDLGGGFKVDKQGRKFRIGPNGGFPRVGGPTDGQIDDASNKGAQLNNALMGIDAVDRQLAATKDIGPLGWITNPTNLAVLEQTVKDLQLKLKENPYALGVLNGPDLGLLESIVANPSKLKSAVFRQTIAPRLANLSRIVGESYRSEAGRFNGIGGNPDQVIPALYRSPRSRYTAQQWGNQGVVPRNAFAPVGGQPQASGPRQVRTIEEARALPPGTKFIDPNGVPRVR